MSIPLYLPGAVKIHEAGWEPIITETSPPFQQVWRLGYAIPDQGKAITRAIEEARKFEEEEE